jgi:hypothetical protein
MLVDSRGNPLSASDSGAMGPMYGPVRFEDQPAKVRRLGRKQLAGRTKSQRIRKTAWRSRQWKNAGLGHLMAEVEVPRWATKSAEARRSKRRGSGGRKRRSRSGWGYSAARSSYRTSSRRKRRSTGARRSTRGLTRKELRKQNRAAWRAQQSSRKARRGGSSRRTKSKRSSRSSARRSSARRGSARRGSARRSSARRSTARRGSVKRGRRVTYGQIMSQLRGTRTKAWVCAGPKRTGCGGGRKGRRGSRVLGILRG